jgi:hypothetical protein
MEEVKNGNHHDHSHCEACSHDCCGKGNGCGTGFCGRGTKYRILRCVLGVIIIFMLLGLGIKIGEFKTLCGAGFNRVGTYNQAGGFRAMMW